MPIHKYAHKEFGAARLETAVVCRTFATATVIVNRIKDKAIHQE